MSIIKKDHKDKKSFYSKNHEDYEQTYTATWDSSGHGEYWEYDNGEETDHGTW